MFPPLRSNGDTEAGRPARGRIYRLDGSSGSGVGRTGAGVPSGRASARPAAPACPPPQADGQDRRCPRHGPGPDARINGPRDTLDTPRPGSGGNPAQDLTREQTDLDADADTLDTRHGRARAEAPQGRSAAKSRSRRAGRAAHSPADDTTRVSAPPALPAPLRRAGARAATTPEGKARPPADRWTSTRTPGVPPRCGGGQRVRAAACRGRCGAAASHPLAPASAAAGAYVRFPPAAAAHGGVAGGAPPDRADPCP